MNFTKPTVRIQLMSQEHTGGPDYWVVTAHLSTTEGQSVNKSYMGMEKDDALGKVYYFLKLCMKHNTMSADTAMKLEEENNKSPEDKERKLRAIKAHGDLMCDRISYTQYTVLEKLGFPETGYIEVTAPAPGPKWKWYYWFYNPNN